MKSDVPKSYDPAIDTLRTISILAVIQIHTTTRILESVKFDLQSVPWSFFFNQVSRFAVPLFFLLSGFVLEFNHISRINISQYFKKRFSRLFIPYVFWSAIYYYFIYTSHKIGFFHALLTGDSSYQLYFIPALLIFYILFPLLHRFIKILGNVWILSFLVLVQLLFLYSDYYIHPLPYFYPASIALLNFFVFIFGVVAADNREALLKIAGRWKYLLIIASVILSGLIYKEAQILYMKTHNYLYFYSQWRPSVFFYTLSLYGLLYFLFSRILLPVKFIKSVSRLSFFVFFIHVIVLESVWNISGGSISGFYLFILTTGISFLIASLIHRIPNLSGLTG